MDQSDIVALAVIIFAVGTAWYVISHWDSIKAKFKKTS